MPDHHPPFGALLSMMHRNHHIYLNTALKPYGLSAGQFPALMYLYHHPGCMQEAITRHFTIDKGTVARAIRRLEEEGYVIKEIDPENRRAVCLRLTEKALAVCEEIHAIESAWEERLFSDYDPDTRIIITEQILRLTQQSHRIVEDAREQDEETKQEQIKL